MAKRAFFWLVLTETALCGSVAAMTYVHVSDANLAAQADVIATVEVIESTVETSGNRVFSRYMMFIEDLVKGEIDGAYLTVRVPGGLSEELGVELRYNGAPEFRAGEQTLLFLRPNDDGSFRVLHFAMGAFWQRSAELAPIYVRDMPEPGDRPATSIDVARDADRFVSWLRDEVAGLHRNADYLVDLPERQSSFVAPFTIFEPLRAWVEFQRTTPQQVTWKRHKTGQAGVPKKGKSELKNIFKVLNNTPDSQGDNSGLVRLALKGKVKTSKLPELDGVCVTDNLLVFDDAVDLIDEVYNCITGGVIAVGGACRFTQPSGVWKGQNVFAATSGRVVFNSNTKCFYERPPRVNGDTPTAKFGEVAMHEILHTLGLRHACGDKDSPNCSDSAVLDDASMRASVHGDGRGAQLRDDDLSGFWQLYDLNYFATPCHLPPGHKNFCKQCGPCGEGQGACKKNRHCSDGLKCKNNSALGFKTCK